MVPFGSSSDLRSLFRPRTASGSVLSVWNVARTSLIHCKGCQCKVRGERGGGKRTKGQGSMERVTNDLFEVVETWAVADIKAYEDEIRPEEPPVFRTRCVVEL